MLWRGCMDTNSGKPHLKLTGKKSNWTDSFLAWLLNASVRSDVGYKKFKYIARRKISAKLIMCNINVWLPQPWKLGLEMYYSTNICIFKDYLIPGSHSVCKGTLGYLLCTLLSDFVHLALIGLISSYFFDLPACNCYEQFLWKSLAFMAMALEPAFKILICLASITLAYSEQQRMSVPVLTLLHLKPRMSS